MASIELTDGRVVPVVKPSIKDQMMLERQMRTTRKKYGPADFAADLKLASFQQAFAIFASFNRAGVPTTIHEVLELDMDDLGKLIKLDPSETADDEDEDGDEDESEGEQGVDPQLARTAAVAAE